MFRQMVQRISAQVPSRCVVCHAWPAQTVCEACVQSFAQPVARCSTCALSVPSGVHQCGACLTNAPPVERALAAVAYDYPWSALIGQFKFQQDPGLARTFAQMMRSAPWFEPALEAADYVIPMPLSMQRLKSRGYNQSLVLALELESRKTIPHLLLRIKDTPPQSTLHRDERLESVKNAFAVDPLRTAQLQGKKVVLLDDVMTSGASMHSAARALRQAGAAHITAMVFARTD
jgi:ComF family protein